MEKADYQFIDFLAEIDRSHRDFAAEIHDMLLQGVYKCKITLKEKDFAVSYSHPKTRRSILNFILRKKGLFVRIYADNLDKYMDFINCIPAQMEAEIEKASACKMLTAPEKHNYKCIQGYDFVIRETRYQKCRYSCFQFAVNEESVPVITEFVKNESRERLAV